MVPVTVLQQPQSIIRKSTLRNLKCRKLILAIAITGPKPQLTQATRSSIWEDHHLGTVHLRQLTVTRNSLHMLEVSTGMQDMDSSLSSSSQAASNSLIAALNQ